MNRIRTQRQTSPGTLRQIVALAAIACILACDKDATGEQSDGATALPLECGAGMPPPNVSACTDEQVAGYYDCVESACAPTLATCYGPDYQMGVYAGACGGLLECVTDCGCDDASCTNACTGAEACGQCFFENPCGTECLPNCYPELGDATCDDLEECCATMAEPQSRADCREVVDIARMLGEFGDLECSSAYTIFEPFCQ